MKEGIYYDMPAEEYRSIKAANYSGLKYFLQSPAHYWANCRDPEREIKEATPAMKLGSAIHTAVLEPFEFPSRYIVAPNFDKRTKEGKRLWEEFETENTGKEFITSDQFDVCEGISNAVRKAPAAQVIFESGKPEVVIVWRDPIEDVLCKARLDWYAPGVCIFDPKSCESAKHSDFAKNIANYSYHLQAAMYVEGIAVLTGEILPFIFGAFEKSKPYAVGFFTADDNMIQIGKAAYRHLLAMYAECERNNEWPSYDDSIQEISLPKWAQNGI